MKDFKRTIATILAMSTLCSVTAIPTLNISANDVQLGDSYDYQSSYAKRSISGATGIVVIEVSSFGKDPVDVDDDDKVLLNDGSGNYAYLQYYYLDDDTNGIHQVDDLDLSTLNNVMVFKDTLTLSEEVLDLLNKHNLGDYYDMNAIKDFTQGSVCYYNSKDNEYLEYGFDSQEWLVTNIFLPDQYLPSQMPNKVTDVDSYIHQSEDILIDKYVAYNHIDISDHNLFAIVDSGSKEYDGSYLYYKPDGSLASFEYSVSKSLYFRSTNENITLDDVLTKQQQQYLFTLSGNALDLTLNKIDVDSDTGEIEYSICLYNDGNTLSDKDFMEYVYGVGQSIINKGVSNNCYFGGYAIFDTINYNDIISVGKIVVTTNEETSQEEFTAKYKDILGSDYTISSSNDKEYTIVYSKVANSNVVKELQSADGINTAICTEYDFISTELGQYNHYMLFNIPIVNDIKVTIGESSQGEIAINGDVNGDGKVSTVDMLLLKKHILGITTLDSTGYKYVVGDVNGDGNVTTSDLILLKKAILGTIDYTLLTNTIE